MRIPAKVIPGYGVASGKGGDPRYKDGTIKLQIPHFLVRGLDLTSYFPGTLNVDVAPKKFKVVKPKYSFEKVDWSEHISPENFFFFDVIVYYNDTAHQGLIYMPDPSTKEQHTQRPTTLEFILPKIQNLIYGSSVEIEIVEDQMLFTD